MQIAKKKSASCCYQIGPRGFLPKTREPLHIRVTTVNLLFLAAFVCCICHTNGVLFGQNKPPILIDSEFTQTEKLQLRFWPMGKYAASTYTSHIRIPLNYYSLPNLQTKMNKCLDDFLATLYEYKLCIDDWDKATLNSAFQFYKQNTDDVQ
jgi:hypothetical protein